MAVGVVSAGSMQVTKLVSISSQRICEGRWERVFRRMRSLG